MNVIVEIRDILNFNQLLDLNRFCVLPVSVLVKTKANQYNYATHFPPIRELGIVL